MSVSGVSLMQNQVKMYWIIHICIMTVSREAAMDRDVTVRPAVQSGDGKMVPLPKQLMFGRKRELGGHQWEAQGEQSRVTAAGPAALTCFHSLDKGTGCFQFTLVHKPEEVDLSRVKVRDLYQARAFIQLRKNWWVTMDLILIWIRSIFTNNVPEVCRHGFISHAVTSAQSWWLQLSTTSVWWAAAVIGDLGTDPLPLLSCERANAAKANVSLHVEELKVNKATHLWGENKQTNRKPQQTCCPMLHFQRPLPMCFSYFTLFLWILKTFKRKAACLPAPLYQALYDKELAIIRLLRVLWEILKYMSQMKM